MCCLEKWIAEDWESDGFVEEGVVIPDHEYDLPWIAYEDYMQAQFVEAVPGLPGKVIVKFPPWTREDKGLHVHPISDRIILVLEGSGEFVAIREGQGIRIALVPGNRIWMPRGIAHNFIAGPDGLLIESLHLPFIPLEDPQCLVKVE